MTPTQDPKPRIAITIGDPGGVGAEIALKALADPALATIADWLLITDAAPLEAAARTSGIDPATLPAKIIETHNLDPKAPFEFGELCAEYGVAAIGYVHDATEMCLRGEADAMVTAPLNKEAVTLSGRHSPVTPSTLPSSATPPTRACCSPAQRLSVVHVSTHISPRAKPATSTAAHHPHHRTRRRSHEAHLGKPRPRIAVCGLNPHAGEHGLFGTEDERFILPAVEACRARWHRLRRAPSRPTPSSSAPPTARIDLIVAMYHDQGHIPMKLLDFEATVNISLGIPILRTSVDHGTAFDIAGKNIAGAANMKAAIRMAVTMARHRLQHAVTA